MGIIDVTTTPLEFSELTARWPLLAEKDEQEKKGQ